MDAGRFHQHAQGSTPLSFTGERVVPDEPGWEWCFEAHRFGYEALIERLPQDAVVLDIGSGEGYGTASLARSARLVVGMDYSFEAVSHASERYGSGKLAFVVADAQRLPFRSDAFDVVSSLQVIEHFTDTQAHLRDVARVLRGDGFHFCATPNIALASPEEAANEWHLRDFDAPDLRSAMDGSFAQVEILGQFYIEDSPRVRAMRDAETATAPKEKLQKLESVVGRLPGPLRVRLRPLLRRVLRIPLVDADAARNAIRAEDFTLGTPAEESFCLFAIARGPKL